MTVADGSVIGVGDVTGIVVHRSAGLTSRINWTRPIAVTNVGGFFVGLTSYFRPPNQALAMPHSHGSTPKQLAP